MNITDVTDYTLTGVFDIDASIKANEDSSKVKHVTLRVNFNAVPLRDIITKSLDPTRISWANGGSGRRKFDTIVDRSVLNIDFTSPGKTVKSRDENLAEVMEVLVSSGVRTMYPDLTDEQLLAMATKVVDNRK